MTSETHAQLANFIWSICNLLRGPYKRNEYRKVILPLTVLRRFDCLLAPTKAAVLKVHEANKARPDSVLEQMLLAAAERPFYNLSKLDFRRLLDDPNQLAANLVSYINAFSPNVRTIMERFAFEVQITKMADKNLLFNVIQAFCSPRVDLSADKVDNLQMGYVFEELIRIGSEQANEEAGEHFTPREVIKLMVNLLLSPEKDLARSHVVKTIYDPACGTGGMLSVAEEYIRSQNAAANPILFGQDWNDEAWAVCTSDMLIKGQDAGNIRRGDTFKEDRFELDDNSRKWTFDYMLANPPFGVEWKNQQQFIEHERASLGFAGRFGAGTPRINDGALLFLQHMISKMRAPKDGGSRIGIVFNGSPLFTGDAGSGESAIRQWIIEDNDWLEAIVALPDQLFYNTGISTYIWVLTNRKDKRRKGKVQLVDARQFFIKMKKSLGNKRNKIGEGVDNEPDHIGDIARIHGGFQDGETRTVTNGVKKSLVVCKVFDNENFGFRKITVERPLRLGFPVTLESIARLDQETAFRNLTSSSKKNEAARLAEVEAGRQRQEQLRALLLGLLADHEAEAFIAGEKPCEMYYMGHDAFQEALTAAAGSKGDRLSAAEKKMIVAALGERNEAAAICRNRDGSPEPDPELRDTENVPLKEDVEEYFKREVLPHVPDAWIDHGKTKVGYEIPFNRHFYRYEPPRELAAIEADIKGLEDEILALLRDETQTLGERGVSTADGGEGSSEIVIYEPDGLGEKGVEVRVDRDTVWLTQRHLANLLDTSPDNISLHLKNIYADGELTEVATAEEISVVQLEGKRSITRRVKHYNLDAIISVGYRVNSRRGVQFRQWATRILREHLEHGYTLNQYKLAQLGMEEARQSVELLSRTLTSHAMVTDAGRSVLALIVGYAKTWRLLQQYDEGVLGLPDTCSPSRGIMAYATAQAAIGQLKAELVGRREATDMFGQERGKELAGILGNIEQTMFGEELYKSREEKAAHLLYFIIKDHPFVDGNKRIGSFLFLLYLDQQGVSMSPGADALTALSLLIAESPPASKDLMVRLVANLLVSRTTMENVQ